LTREEFMLAWPSLTTLPSRVNAFEAWMIQEQSRNDDLLPSFVLTLDPNVASISKVGTNEYLVASSIFDNPGDLEGALSAGDYIRFYARAEAERAWYQQLERSYKANKARQKYLDKLWKRLTKDSKPKGSKAGYGKYLFDKLMKELEGGSG